MELEMFNNGKENQTISSREIAEITGKMHKNVLSDCDKLNESYQKMGLAEILAGVYFHENTGKQKHREFLLSKMQSMDLMTGYNAELRIKVNRRWEELERKQNGIPQNFSEALKLAYEQSVLIEDQKKVIETNKPKVLFANAVIGSVSSCLIGELAKIICQNGFEIGQNRLFEWLRAEGYLGKFGERKNIPNQKYIEQGLFELKKGIRSGNDGVMHQTITPKVTGKGQVYFVNKFLNDSDEIILFQED